MIPIKKMVITFCVYYLTGPETIAMCMNYFTFLEDSYFLSTLQGCFSYTHFTYKPWQFSESIPNFFENK